MHYSVMKMEVLESLNIKDSGIYVDGTLGYAGVSKEILKRMKRGFLFAFDQDEEAIKYSDNELKKIGNNYKLFHTNFVNLKNSLFDEGIREVDGIVEWYIIDTINVSEIQYNDYEVSFEGYEITNADDSKTAIKFDYFKLDNISGNEIKLQSMAVYSLETGMTYEINEFEFAEGTEQIAFEGDVINDIRHDGKTFMLAIQLKKDGKIVENIPTTLTITVSGIDDPVNPFIDNGENGRVAAYFNLSDCLKTLGGDIIDFTISIPSGYELYAVQLLEAENANKPAMSEVRATIYHSPLNN